MALDPANLINAVEDARNLISDESVRAGPCGAQDRSTISQLAITDSDLAALRAKFPFLKEFSDGFIRANKPDCIMRMETANMKLREGREQKTQTTVWPTIAPT
jgi:hypothetical protein